MKPVVPKPQRCAIISNGSPSIGRPASCMSGGPKAASRPFIQSGVTNCECSALQREATGPWIFESERGGQMTADNLNKLVKRLGDGSNLLRFPLHPHMLPPS